MIFLLPGQVSRLLKVTLHKATACQRQPFLIYSFRYFSSKTVETVVFCHGYQTRDMVEAQKSLLHVCFFNIIISVNTCRVIFATRLTPYKYIFKTIDKHVRQYFSTSSLIARPVNGLLFLFGGRTDDYTCQILVSLTDCSFTYDHFQKTQQLARGERKIVLSVDIWDIR